MKITEIIMENENKKGTYAAYHFSDETTTTLKEFCEANNIPNALNPEDFHSTLLYSRKYLPDYEPAGCLDQPLIATPIGFEVWTSPANAFKENETKCLILKYECKGQVERFNQLMSEHEATYDYDEYKPHVTLSYDIGDFDISELDISQIPPLEAVEEYAEELNLDKTF
jgi:hypothetical protein